uniref:Serine/threonine-protein phosphatase 7 long form homolog n=1 Tax=Nicotiana tabacum TaxID=4097 RepID=A0A1S4B5B5_TOBAC|nr:PREDICTED: serine/threonine-protein phosphatase 7 long form homolog [Nicotiana tabacum]
MDATTHPGPRTLDLLVLQPQHRSEYIWDGQLLTQTFRARRVELLWEFLSPPRVRHPCVVHYLEEMGLYRIIMIGRIQLDYVLITTLIERWRPETHTFHLPIGEATITLQDTEILYGLSADGLPVLLPAIMRYYSWQAYWDMLHMLTGFMPEDEERPPGADPPYYHRRVSGGGCTAIYEAAVAPSIWGVLFPNTSENLVSLRFLHHIARFEDTAIYSWDGAVISYLPFTISTLEPLLEFLLQFPGFITVTAAIPGSARQGEGISALEGLLNQNARDQWEYASKFISLVGEGHLDLVRKD